MLVKSIKEIAENLNWKFDYGKDYWQNRGDYADDGNLPFEERKKYLSLLWKDRDFVINKHGGIEGYVFFGEMLLLVRSRISDPTYQYKYQTHIEKLEACAELLYQEFNDCDGWKIKAWKEIEVSNVYDTNMDGLKINFTMEYDG